jgi:hypothetical protein
LIFDNFEKWQLTSNMETELGFFYTKINGFSHFNAAIVKWCM